MLDINIQNASKSFGGVPALRDVELRLTGGEVHALMGENGAGKSTLIKLLAGVLPADDLSVTINNIKVPFGSSSDAKKAGFQFIHQELNIVPHLSVAENICLGFAHPKKFAFLVDWPKLQLRAEAALHKLGVNHINVRQQAARLTTGDQMLMRIAGSLVGADDDVRTNSLYVFDEPTAAMSDREAEMLFKVIRGLRDAGKAILYVSHRMNEVMQLADQITVLRDGLRIQSTPISETSREDIIFAMTGRDFASAHPQKTGTRESKPFCTVQKLETRQIKAVNFTLHRGEILGVAGLANAGQTSVFDALLGVEKPVSGSIDLHGGQPPANIVEAWKRQLAYVPRERRREALMLKRPVRDNIALAQLSQLAHRTGLMRQGAERARCAQLAKAVGLKYESLDQPVYQLSGGNQQKVVFARALSVDPQMLLLDEPTRGVDVGAKFEIYSLLRDLAAKGCSILLSSSDLPELIGMCDRILIMQDGAQVEIVSTDQLQPAQLLQKLYGPHAQEQVAS